MTQLPVRAGVLAVLTVLLIAALWTKSSGDATSVPGHTALATAPRHPTDAPAPFAPSLQGTQEDGELQRTSAGGLPLGELRRLFDYYLTTQGEQPLEAITQQLRRVLHERLPVAARAPAERVLGLYLAYKQALVALETRTELVGNSVQAIRGRLDAVHDLRALYFSEREIADLFGSDDAYDRDAVARLEVSQDPHLTPTQKSERLASLDAAMPEDLRTQREAPFAIARLEQRVQSLRAQGASEDEIYRHRAQELDAQAAARLADLDREQARWTQRIDHYRRERARILQTASPDTSGEQQTLAQLQRELFSESERPRLSAYE